ncbi:MAG: hypothetical protein ACFFD2_01045, partial [Promethearchaeota archaeon]
MNRKGCIILIPLITSLLFTIYYIFNKSQTDNFNQIINNQAPFQSLNTLELPIGIYYDIRYSEPWNFYAQKLTSYLNQTLCTHNLTVFVLNATELKSFMENNPSGIIIITMGVAPNTIWNGSENSFVETWLDNGGIIIWTGCQEFYWIGYESGQNIPVGEIGSTYVLDMNYIETISDQHMIPTQLGNDLFINFSSHTTDVFSSISALTTANVYFEVYAKNGDWADPVLFQPKNGKGYFVRIHTDWNDKIFPFKLSTWISSFIYNRFFKLPIITATELINSIFFLTSKELSINITNFSEFFGFLQINSTSNGFLPINTSLVISPLEKKSLNFTVIPLKSARFQQYELQLNFFSNYTDLQNRSIILQIYSKNIQISIEAPISSEVLEFSEKMYPGGTYSISCEIQKYINESFSVDVILICGGAINELKTNVNLEQNSTILQIPFSIQMMAKSGLYYLHIYIYQNGILLSSSNISIQIESIFQNPVFILIVFLLSSIILILLSFYLYLRKKRANLEQKVITILKNKNKIFLKNITN